MRIAIIGRPGSGKSTFAFTLSCKLNIPVYHLDKFYFVQAWQKRDYNDFLKIQQSLVDQPRWIIEGCSLQSLELRYARATHCILLDHVPRLTCLYRLLTRRWFKNSKIDDRAQNCPESISWELIRYMWTFDYRLDHRLSRQLKDLQTRFPKTEFKAITTRQDFDTIISWLTKQST